MARLQVAGGGQKPSQDCGGVLARSTCVLDTSGLSIIIAQSNSLKIFALMYRLHTKSYKLVYGSNNKLR
jgi:hypothetical protein